MIPSSEKLRELISRNKLDFVFATLLRLSKTDSDMQSQILTLLARFNDIRKKENLNLVSSSDATIIRSQINYATLNIITAFEKNISASSNLMDLTPKKTVFISYNHHDSDVANKLKEKLEGEKIEVIIDSENMLAGDDIKEFIEKSVRDTEITISIVSKNSLLSAWVCMETIDTYYHEKSNANKKFIPCYLENSFLDINFTDMALNSIDDQIKKIEAIVKARMAKGLNTRDVNNNYTRLLELRNSIDEIIRRLRECFCVDIGSDNFEKNFKKILQKIKE